MKRRAWQVTAAVISMVLLLWAGFRYYTSTEDFIKNAGKMASDLGTEILQTRVEISEVRVSSLCSLLLKDIVIYDKENAILARTEAAQVRFSPFAMLIKSPASAISEVELISPYTHIKKLENGKWNYEALIKEDEEKSDFDGEIKIENGSFIAETDEEKITFTKINAELEVDSENVSLDGSVNLEGDELKFSGDIALDDGKSLNLRISSEGVNLKKTLPKIPYEAITGFNFLVTGDVNLPHIEGKAWAKEGTIYGYGFNDAKVKAVFSKNHLLVEDLTGKLAEGDVKISAQINTENSAFKGTALLDGVNLELVSSEDIPLGGRLGADLGFSGVGGDDEELTFYGTVTGDSLVYSDVNIPKLKVSFFSKGKDLTVDYFSANFENDGELGIEGKLINGDSLDFKFYGTHIDLSMLAKVENSLDVTGLANFNGSVEGAIENPVIRSDFVAINGKLFKQPYNVLKGKVAGNLDGVKISDFSLENGGAETWLVKGIMGFKGDKYINLQVDTVGARMEDIAALVAPDQKITGKVDNTINITGTLKKPYIEGYIHCYHASYNGLLMQGMDGVYTLNNGIVSLKDFRIFSPLVDMILNGEVMQNGNMDLLVEAKELSLERFGGKLPYPMSGQGRFEGHIKGNFNNPLFMGMLYADKLDLNGALIENVHGTVHYQGKNVRFEDFGFEQNGGYITLNVDTNVDTLAVDGLLEVKNADMNNLLAMFNFKNDIINGRFDGKIHVGGKTTSLLANLEGVMLEGDVRGYRFKNLFLDMILDGRKLYLKRFEGKQGDNGVFVTAGSIDFDGPINVAFSAKGIDAGLLAKLANENLDLSGDMQLDANIGGTISNPEAQASLDIKSGGARGAGFDSAVGLFSLKNNVLRVEQFLVEKSDMGKAYKLSAYGNLPVPALLADKNYQGAEQFDLRINLTPGDISLLPMIAPGVDWALGDVKGELHVTGTTARPLIRGDISMDKGAVKLKELQLPFTEMKMKLVFDGDSFAVDNFSGKLGKGVYDLKGFAQVDGLELIDYKFNFNADKLEVLSDVYKGPLTFFFTLDEGFHRKKKLPRLSGRVFVEDTTISIPTIPESESEMPNFIIDVGLELGKKVRFYSPYLADLRLAGGAKFRGTVHRPSSSGNIAVTRGTINYLKTNFKVRECSLNFTNVGSFLPNLNLFADTRLNRTRIYFSVRGPLDKMKLKFFSSPEMGEDDILKLLTLRGGNITGEGANEYTSIAEIGLRMAFLSEVEAQMRELFSLDEFSINYDTEEIRKSGDNSSKEVYNVEMGKYISEKIMLRYIQSIGGDKQRYGVRYDFDDRTSFGILHDEDNAFRFEFEARIKF